MSDPSPTQLGQYPAPDLTIAHFSDPHLLANGALLYGAVNTTAHLVEALSQLEASAIRPDAIVFTGDLADLGEPDAYRVLRETVEPVAERMGAQLIWVMGNHDERGPYARELFDEHHPGVDTAPHDRVYDVDGLRVIALDSSVPGYHHGALEPRQLEWLREVLATPSPRGSILALHHPPLPSPLNEPMAMIELDDQQALAEAIHGSDIRAILGGHLHYSCHGLFAGIPVSVASATCYTLNLIPPSDRILVGNDANQAVSIVSVYGDQIVHSTVPVGDFAAISGYPAALLARAEQLSPHERRELFSRKDAVFGPEWGGAEASAS